MEYTAFALLRTPRYPSTRSLSSVCQPLAPEGCGGNDSADWTTFLVGWRAVLGEDWVTSQQVADTAWDKRWSGTFPAGKDGAALSVKSLGRRLAGQKGRYHGTFVLRGSRDSHTKLWWWRAETWTPRGQGERTLDG